MALGLLSFVVSLFIAFQAANQAWHNRGILVAQIRLLGVDLFVIRIALFIEAWLLIITASLIGVGSAYVLVSMLLPLLGFTLEQLYQLNISGHLAWNWHYFFWSITISSMAVFVALAKQLLQLNTQKISLFAKQIQVNNTHSRFIVVNTFAVLILVVTAFVWPSENWHQLMIKHSLILVIAVASLPLILIGLLVLLNKLNLSFNASYLIVDCKNQVKRRFLPLAAFFIALTASISAALMINSFEAAFVKYLDQHLNQDVYIRFNLEQKDQLIEYLNHHENVAQYVLYHRGTVQIQQDTLTVTTVASQRQYDSIVFKSSRKQTLYQILNSGCYINEQYALKRNVAINDVVTLTQSKQSSEVIKCQVQGIYFDYGNPGFEITLALAFVQQQQLNVEQTGIGVYFKKFTTKELDYLQDKLTFDSTQLYQPQQVKLLALSVFEQTFLLTQAIAAALLVIACFGLFLSVNSLVMARKSDLFILISLGYSRREIFTHMLAQWLLLAGGCILMSWPIAVVLANALVTEILPASFGWSMPLKLVLSPFILSSLMGLLCLIPALYLTLKKINFGTRV
jgi:putative ABC transport system permease protein